MMRYGHMVRQQQTNLPLPPMMPAPSPSTHQRSQQRQASQPQPQSQSNSNMASNSNSNLRVNMMPLSKNAKTLALDVRNTLTKARTPGLALILLASPFIIALFTLISGTFTSSRRLHASKIMQVHPRLPDHNHHGIGQPAPPSVKAGFSKSLVRFDLDKFLTKQRQRHSKLISSGATNSTVSKSVTLIAACQDRHSSLLLSYPSWSSVEGIDQIVLVEWSDTPYDWNKIPQFMDDEKSHRLTIVLTKGIPKSQWALTRAYNLASKFAIHKYILKVDCDTHLQSDFLIKNPPPNETEYYTISQGTERTQNEKRLHGVFFSQLSDFNRIRGYDERLMAYGYEDVELYDRFNKLAGLTSKPFDLDSLRHNVGANFIYNQESNRQVVISRRVSIRVNQNLIEKLPKWPDIYDLQSMKYLFLFNTDLKLIVANATHHAPDPFLERSVSERETLLSSILRTGLHDDFDLPWDLLESLSYEDLHHLANYVDHTESKPHVLIVVLEGQDALTNTFNLVSAIYLAMTRGRPTIIVWTLPDDGHLTDSTSPIISDLFDMNATNIQLQNIMKSEGMIKHIPTIQSLSSASNNGEHVRIMAAYKWCNEGLDLCASKYDKAYKLFFEIKTGYTRVYDETDPIPLSTSHHSVVRLGDKTLLGSHELRSMAMRSLVPSQLVRDIQAQEFIHHSTKLGIVMAFSEAKAIEEFSKSLKAEHAHTLEQANEEKQFFFPVVGRGHVGLRKIIFGRDDGDLFCGNGLIECTAKQIGRQVANVLTMCDAEELYPKHFGIVDKSIWNEKPEEADLLMASDLWLMHHNL